MSIDLRELFPPEELDAAATHISVFLQELVMQFDARHLAQLRREQNRRRRHHDNVDPWHPWLTKPRNKD